MAVITFVAARTSTPDPERGARCHTSVPSLIRVTVEITSYGRPATEALARVVASAKGGDALAPVTVVVPSNFAGLVARRMLGSGMAASDGLTNGIANVSFVTPFRLAELLAAGRLGDRRPLTNPVLGAAVRVALAEDPHHFAAVADHQATERALAQLTGELSNVSNAALDRVAGSSRTASSAIAFHRSVQARLVDFHDEAHVAQAAARRTDLASDPEQLGAIIWYLPSPMAAPLRRLMRSFQQVGRLTTIVGLTGASDADQPVRDLCAAVGVDLTEAAPQPRPAAPRTATLPPHADRIVSVTDADEEVRAVVRSIVELASGGMPLDRIGVFHATPDPYVRILQQQLTAGGLPSNGPSRTRLADAVAGRALLVALDLPAERWRRDRLMALASGGPLRLDGGSVRPAVWERLTREIGVVAGLSDWHAKIAGRRRTLRATIDRGEAESWLVDRINRELADLDDLATFVSTVSNRVAAVDAAISWREKSVASLELLRSLLGPAHQHTSWPEDEQVAFERVETALERLATLDEIEPEPSRSVFVRAVRGELDVARGRAGRFGHGVVYGPLSSAVGHDLDAVFVLGCREGLLPSPRRDDAVLPDSARALAGGELELRTGQLGEQHRQFLAAIAAAPVGFRTLTFARGDLRSSRESLPSRWLLDTATALAGRPIRATDFADLVDPAVDVIASHQSALRAAAFQGSATERDLASVEQHVAIGGDAADHPAAATARRGIAAARARRGEAFTEWDGNLAGHEIGTTADRPLSPTRLQAWAACGYRYFLAYVLGLADRDDPDRLVDISPLDRGSGVHLVLETFLRELLEQDEMPSWNEPWTTAHRERVAELATEVFDAYEMQGRTGRPVRWRITREDLLMLLDDFLHADNVHRRTNRATPFQVEMPFGLGDSEALAVDLPDGRTLRFRGMADRLDRSDDGRTFVTDYKTGKGREYERIDQGDPVNAGTTLQLGIYAEAARQLTGAEAVEAHYWQINQAVGHRRSGYPWDDERRRRLVDVLTVIADGIEGGEFAMDPGEWNSWRGTNETCMFCAFDSVCDRDRGEHASEKADQLVFRPRLLWVDPDSDDAVGGPAPLPVGPARESSP